MRGYYDIPSGLEYKPRIFHTRYLRYPPMHRFLEWPVNFIQGGAPPVMQVGLRPCKYRYINPINHSEIEVMFTNLASDLWGTTLQDPSHGPPRPSQRHGWRLHVAFQHIFPSGSGDGLDGAPTWYVRWFGNPNKYRYS